MNIRRVLFSLMAILVVSFITPQPTQSAESIGILRVEELEALAALRYGNATPKQHALLFMRNDAVNRAALQGYITDDLYQAAQRDYARTNQRFAQNAAREAGAEFRVQTASSSTYSPGTDSDYITKVTDPDQVAQMQQGYNKRINKYLADSGLDVRRSDWHVQLDTDFMADPSGVTEEQFRTIAKLNNDAYKRRAAAEYEAVSRAADGTRVTPEQFTAYAEEMKDFIAKKQKLLAQMRQDPRRLTSPNFRAEFQKLMAQEQKYISRIEGSNTLLRHQRQLTPIQSLEDATVWSIKQADDGTWRMVRDATIAQLGSKRTANGFRTTAVANAVAQNSLENALERLAQSSAEAALKDPDFSRRAATDIASLLADFSPARKAAFLESIARSEGENIAREITLAMRKQHRAALKAGGAGARLWAGRILKALQAAGVVYDLYQAGDALKEYAEALQAALDPNITDAEAERHFARAQAAAARLALVGGLGALFEAYPPVAAGMGSFAISFYGTRMVLENTETGQKFDVAVADYLDRHVKAAEQFVCDAKEFFGYVSECEKLRKVDQRVLEAALKAIREGRKQLAEGFTMLEIIEAIRRGDYSYIRKEILVDSDQWKATQKELADLKAALATLRENCAPAHGRAPVNDNRPATAIGDDPVTQACLGAAQAIEYVKVKRLAVETLTKRAVDGFSVAEQDFARCTSVANLDTAFSGAQAASSNAANAARVFIDLAKTIDTAGDLIVNARRAAAESLEQNSEGGRECTRKIENLIDAAAKAHEVATFPRLRKQILAVQIATADIAKARGDSGLSAKDRDLAACSELEDLGGEQLDAMKAILSLKGIPEKRRAIELAAQDCRDKLDGEAVSAAEAAPAPSQTTEAEEIPPTGAQSNPEELRNCLCRCLQGRTNFSCSYNPTKRGDSPSCRKLDNGPCICEAMGCFRKNPPTSGECYQECGRKFGG